MRADFFFFLAIFVFIFVAWVATGGPQKPISFAGPFITPITDTGQTQSGYGDFWDIPRGTSNWWGGSFGGGGSSGGGNIQSELWRTQDKLEDVQTDLQEARLFGTPSVYKGVVSIARSAGSLSKTDPDEEYVLISVSGSAKENINMTGWRLVSVRTKSSARIPGATSVFRSGSVNSTSDLILSPGQRAIVTTGKSPVGVSFRENACVGYLAQRQDFVPSLSQSCPSPSDDFARFYDGAAKDYQTCKDRVNELSRCETPSRAGSASSACYSFMREHLTYNGCVTYHANDRNFWSRTWRVYLGQRDDLWAERNDTIKLLDSAGNTVDAYSY